MSKLTSKQRASIPTSKFALPAERKYPVEDRSHAANAKARAAQQVKVGHLSQSQYQQVVSKANAVLGRKK